MKGPTKWLGRVLDTKLTQGKKRRIVLLLVLLGTALSGLHIITLGYGDSFQVLEVLITTVLLF